eukprot:TRINITY_DN6617_c2_g1_i1.p2 TRINITY_DN6617_c2_g1~~TRINITY_DN6617_c2_g1_i1.p2  ORF type:complete len:154 (-),score=82.61 TRINITY_DN6617_c2_g1_i1:551-1012(-)
MVSQAVALAKRPHVVIATPGRLVDHLENTKGFNLRAIKFLALDEADRMLSMDFEEEINKLLAVIPRERNTYLFSATMTSKVAKLQRASLRDPAKVEVAHRFTTPKTLVQQYLFVPAKYKVSERCCCCCCCGALLLLRSAAAAAERCCGCGALL